MKVGDRIEITKPRAMRGTRGTIVEVRWEPDLSEMHYDVLYDDAPSWAAQITVTHTAEEIRLLPAVDALAELVGPADASPG